jgi:hypothetical protein
MACGGFPSSSNNPFCSTVLAQTNIPLRTNWIYKALRRASHSHSSLPRFLLGLEGLLSTDSPLLFLTSISIVYRHWPFLTFQI